MSPIDPAGAASEGRQKLVIRFCGHPVLTLSLEDARALAWQIIKQTDRTGAELERR